jgi:hypothetical protein
MHFQFYGLTMLKKMTKIYVKLNFVLSIDKELNVSYYRNEFDSNDSGPTSADLKST